MCRSGLICPVWGQAKFSRGWGIKPVRPPSIPIRHYQLVEVNGSRESVISRHMTRFEATRAKQRIEGTVTGRLIIRVRWS